MDLRLDGTGLSVIMLESTTRVNFQTSRVMCRSVCIGVYH
jgi:hypothetical protein